MPLKIIQQMELISVYLTIGCITNYSSICIHTKIIGIALPHMPSLQKDDKISFHLPKIGTSVFCYSSYGLFHGVLLFPAFVQCSDFKTYFRGPLRMNRALIPNIYEMMVSCLALYKIKDIFQIYVHIFLKKETVTD